MNFPAVEVLIKMSIEEENVKIKLDNGNAEVKAEGDTAKTENGIKESSCRGK